LLNTSPKNHKSLIIATKKTIRWHLIVFLYIIIKLLKIFL
jgi:hypothetical protein